MAIAINVPDIGTDEVEVTEVLVSVGDHVEKEQSLITVEGNKASLEVPAPFAGTIKEINLKVGDQVRTGSLMMVVESDVIATTSSNAYTHSATSSADAEDNITKAKANTEPQQAEDSNNVHATPVIRRMAREFGINLAKVKGHGRKGRIIREDINSYLKIAVKRAEEAAPTVLPGLLSWPNIDFGQFGETEEVLLGKIQKISGARLQRNSVLIPHVTQFDEADITEVEAFRKQQNAEAEQNKIDVKITILVFILKAVAKALEELPRFNSSLSEDGQKLTLKKYINISVAMDTSTGLVVPVFRDVNKKGIITLSRELANITQKARTGQLTSADMQGGCFTISNLGRRGGQTFTPIINAPEVAILGVSKLAMKPIWNGKEFTPRLMLPLSLSYDHRVIDGAQGALFINKINNLISDIRCLVM